MRQAQQPSEPLERRGKRVLVIGLGVHGGLGVTRFLVEQGAEVAVTDLRTADQLQSSLAHLHGLPVRYVLGEHGEVDFRATDVVIRNPGVPQESPLLGVNSTF
jgi:UDP-N-acetylmuramoylalanine--D-glutamate ligase